MFGYGMYNSPAFYQPFGYGNFGMNNGLLNFGRSAMTNRGLLGLGRSGINGGLFGLGRSTTGILNSGGLRGITGAVRGINWGTLITNAGRTLNVVNQAIPIIKQTGPMFNNMKTMLKLASVFKDETDTPRNNYHKQDTYINKDVTEIKKEEGPREVNQSNQPTFFL